MPHLSRGRRGRRGLLPIALALAVIVLIAGAAVANAAFRPTTLIPVRVAAISAAVTPARIAPLGQLVAKKAKVEAERRMPLSGSPQEDVRSSEATPGAPRTRPPAPAPPAIPLAFDTGKAMAHVRMLSETIGQRVGGTAGERRAVDYAAGQLRGWGYDVGVQDVPLPNGRTSHNVIARKRGATGPIVVLGGHIDSKSPAPGADDNASGVGTVLELARDFAKTTTPSDVRFVAFGCEELIGDGNSDHHHFGSRKYVLSLTGAERARFAAMVSIDMIGYGPDFRVRTMGIGTRDVADRLIAAAKKTGAPLSYLKDPGSTGWSDHEPFERAGLPAAWLEWRDDPNAHSGRDTYGRLYPGKIRTTGVLVNRWVASLSARDLRALVRNR